MKQQNIQAGKLSESKQKVVKHLLEEFQLYPMSHLQNMTLGEPVGTEQQRHVILVDSLRYGSSFLGETGCYSYHYVLGLNSLGSTTCFVLFES